jgi:hypothetical protein
MMQGQSKRLNRALAVVRWLQHTLFDSKLLAATSEITAVDYQSLDRQQLVIVSTPCSLEMQKEA